MNARSSGEQQKKDDVNRDARHAADLVDRRLLSAIANGRDEVAMETLYRHYQDRLVPFLYRLHWNKQIFPLFQACHPMRKSRAARQSQFSSDCRLLFSVVTVPVFVPVPP